MATYTPNYLQNKLYSARSDRQLVESFTLGREGVVSTDTDFTYTLPGSLGFTVSTGSAFIKGDTLSTQGMYHARTTANETVTLTTANGSNPRLDQIVLRVYDSTEAGGVNDYAVVEVVTGTATVGATLDNRTGAASLPASSLLLYDVLVGAGVGSLTASAVRDKRMTYGVSRGHSIVATEEARTSTSYGRLTTPDVVSNVVLPTNGLITIYFHALVKNSVTSAASVAVFIGSNQLKKIGNTVPTVDEMTGSLSGGTSYGNVMTAEGGLSNTGQGTSDASTVTTGVIIRPMSLYAAAGTYEISVQYKASSGTVTAKERKLWVEATPF
jgi:hypothetical protein